MASTRGRAAPKNAPETPWFKHPRMVWALDVRDQRRLWQDVSPATGLTLRQAMLFYGEEDRAELFLELEDNYGGDPPLLIGVDGWPTSSAILSDFRIKSGQLREARARLQHCLLEALVTGRLVATGYTANGSLDVAATPIASDRWRTLTPNFEQSTARAPGLVITGILVFEAEAQAGAQEGRPGRFSGPKLRAWYARWVAHHLSAGTEPSRDEELAAARDQFGPRLPRDPLRALRRELAPPTWRRFGRRKRSGA
jgi:hypothetical protein